MGVVGSRVTGYAGLILCFWLFIKIWLRRKASGIKRSQILEYAYVSFCVYQVVVSSQSDSLLTIFRETVSLLVGRKRGVGPEVETPSIFVKERGG